MSQTVTSISTGLLDPGLLTPRPASASGQPAQAFTQSLDHALGQVSQAQAQAQTDAQGLVLGLQGASLDKTLVATLRARLEWSAAVAVRNGVVNAYNAVINMPV